MKPGYLPPMVLVLIMVTALPGCSNKQVRELVDDIAANGAQEAGRVLEVMSTLDQVAGMTNEEICKSTREIYCKAFQMVRDNCNDVVEFCQTVADALYGGSFPTFGMTTCVGVAEEKCKDLIGQEQALGRLCRELRTTSCQ